MTLSGRRGRRPRGCAGRSGPAPGPAPGPPRRPGLLPRGPALPRRPPGLLPALQRPPRSPIDQPPPSAAARRLPSSASLAAEALRAELGPGRSGDSAPRGPDAAASRGRRRAARSPTLGHPDLLSAAGRARVSLHPARGADLPSKVCASRRRAEGPRHRHPGGGQGREVGGRGGRAPARPSGKSGRPRRSAWGAGSSAGWGRAGPGSSRVSGTAGVPCRLCASAPLSCPPGRPQRRLFCPPPNLGATRPCRRGSGKGPRSCGSPRPGSERGWRAGDRGLPGREGPGEQDARGRSAPASSKSHDSALLYLGHLVPAAARYPGREQPHFPLASSMYLSHLPPPRAQGFLFN